jgi:acyl-CoA thioesterase II
MAAKVATSSEDLPPADPADWENGNFYAPFTLMIGLDKLDEWNFRSTYPAYSPGGFTRAYGGHVYAQAALAGARTVKAGFVMHSVTGHFLLLGATNVPFDYQVSVVRDGGGYAQRRVDARQGEEQGVVFTCVVSFKRSEDKVEERAKRERLEEEYKSVLKDVPVEKMPDCPGVDSPL